MMARPKVTLIGAGPGDPELITLRGVRALGAADLVLCDALVHPGLLRHCAADAEIRFVGKRAGRKSPKQKEITDQLIEAARAGKNVVRLKGGDPLLFGRGSEEAEALADAEVDFEIIPGVPSVMGAGAFAGITLTHRELSSSVALLTATESPDKEGDGHDWGRLATATDTLVIFMGVRKLASLMQQLIANGRAAETPAAIVQSASLPDQRVVVGTVGTIADRAKEEGIGTPALTIVGSVVSLRPWLSWSERRPLFGRRILVTRPAEQAPAFARALRDAGAEPIEWPAIRIADPEDSAPLRSAVGNLSRYDWIVFTSANGVTRFFRELERQGGDSRWLGRCRIATIGPKTANALTAYGLRSDRTPDEFRGEAVAETLLAEMPSPATTRILLPRAAVAREVLPDTLRAAGAEVDVVAAYRSASPDDDAIEAIRGRFAAGEVDVVTFTSPSTVEQLLEALGELRPRLETVCIASIGPITTKRAEELGLTVHITASPYTTDGLLEALSAHFARA